MSLTFGTFEIPGTHEEIRHAPWPRQRQRTAVFGNAGETELTGERLARQLAIPMWIYDEFSTIGDLADLITEIEALAEEPADTLTDNSTNLVYPDCKFDAILLQRGPLPSSELGYFWEVVLFFDQLSPPEPAEEA